MSASWSPLADSRSVRKSYYWGLTDPLWSLSVEVCRVSGRAALAGIEHDLVALLGLKGSSQHRALGERTVAGESRVPGLGVLLRGCRCGGSPGGRAEAAIATRACPAGALRAVLGVIRWR